MKIRHYIFQILFSLLVGSVHGQGFVYDQQSTNIIEGAIPLYQANQPVGQSFTPALSTIGFVRLYLYDAGPQNTGATIYVNLTSGSITGTLLGSTTPVFMPVGFSGMTYFQFLTPVAVSPGTLYFFEPMIQSGEVFNDVSTDKSYTAGSAFEQGTPDSFHELWFQEGIVAAPEPSSSLLFFLGTGILFYVRRKK
jgi:hypothetical protein